MPSNPLTLPVANSISAEEIQSLRDEIEELKLQRTDLRKLSAFHEGESLSVQRDAKHLWEGRESAQAEVDRLNALLEEATPYAEEAARWKEEAEALREDNRLRKATAESARVTALLNANKKQESEIERLTGELEAVKGAMEREQSTLDTVRSQGEEIERLKAKLHVVSEGKVTVENELEQAVSRAEDAASQFKDMVGLIEANALFQRSRQTLSEEKERMAAKERDFLRSLEPHIAQLNSNKGNGGDAIPEMGPLAQELQDLYNFFQSLHKEGNTVRRMLTTHFFTCHLLQLTCPSPSLRVFLNTDQHWRHQSPNKLRGLQG
ncbi:hypothetical protein FA13DRAFT_1725446 [Coprinellus micaceus]|uniref:Uncharacterized protein n=1 Tax=Coprinellus micaceus TaxID=71717 RepID=A0A4Y7TUG4_COPMI|nr:hypothetical protein FA13DRAFT_1725446 [Coprinellus micaceus]